MKETCHRFYFGSVQVGILGALGSTQGSWLHSLLEVCKCALTPSMRWNIIMKLDPGGPGDSACGFTNVSRMWIEYNWYEGTCRPPSFHCVSRLQMPFWSHCNRPLEVHAVHVSKFQAASHGLIFLCHGVQCKLSETHSWGLSSPMFRCSSLPPVVPVKRVQSWKKMP